MAKWEYLSLPCWRENDQWQVRTIENKILAAKTITEILNYFGRSEWEVINVVPDDTATSFHATEEMSVPAAQQVSKFIGGTVGSSRIHGNSKSSVVGYRVFMKRPSTGTGESEVQEHSPEELPQS